MTKSKNPPAFPNGGGQFSHRGMLLRDYLAGQAIAGMLASETVTSTYGEADAAERAYDIADAMLAARTEAQPDV